MDVVVDTIVDNILGKASLEAPPTGAVSEKEAREENTSQDTSAAKKKTRNILSHEVQDESSSDIDTVKEEEGAAQEHTAIVEVSESGQDAPRWSSSGVETYAIQCNTCFKWRVIPSKEKYEAIGEHILEQPFVCANAQEWRENIECDDPADLDDNEPTVLWAIDKHNIPRSPRGFYRKVVLRAENAKKFADIYYKTPCGKTLRSMVQVQKYLDEHPELGAKITQFSFTSPKGRTDALGAGVSTKRLLKDETQSSTESRKRMKGSTPTPNPDPLRLKSPGHGQPPRPRPLIGKGPDAKSKNMSASKPNALRPDKSKLKVLASKSGPHLMTVKKEKLEADRGAK